MAYNLKHKHKKTRSSYEFVKRKEPEKYKDTCVLWDYKCDGMKDHD
jgi:hypothetical protein